MGSGASRGGNQSADLVDERVNGGTAVDVPHFFWADYGKRRSMRRSQGQDRERGTAPTSSGSPRVAVGRPVARHAVRPRQHPSFTGQSLTRAGARLLGAAGRATRSIRQATERPESTANREPRTANSEQHSTNHRGHRAHRERATRLSLDRSGAEPPQRRPKAFLLWWSFWLLSVSSVSSVVCSKPFAVACSKPFAVACSKLFSVFSVACSRLPDDLDEQRNDARVVVAAWRATGRPTATRTDPLDAGAVPSCRC
jgi:hypothetical protein